MDDWLGFNPSQCSDTGNQTPPKESSGREADGPQFKCKQPAQGYYDTSLFTTKFDMALQI
jgi:hypothetical protein